MDHWSKAIAAVRNVGEVISRTAQSAQELLRDQELRNKGIQTVINGAQTRLQGIQNGIVQRAGRLQERLQDNRRQLQALLQNLEERLNATQRAWQLQARRRDRVDVQFGRQLITDAPQEVRARLWYVLLENPSLAAPLKCENPGPVPNRLSDDEEAEGPPADPEELDDRVSGVEGRSRARGGGGGTGGSDAGLGSASGSAGGGGRLAAAAAALGFGRGSTASFTSSPSTTSMKGIPAQRDRSGSLVVGGGGSGGGSSATPDASQQGAAAAAGAGVGKAAAGATPAPSVASTPQPSRSSRAGAFMDFGDAGDSDGWELVTGVLGPAEAAGLPGATGPGPAPAHPEAIRIIMERLEALGPQPLDESGSDPVLVAQQAVLEAMLQVPWETGVGLPATYAPDCRFALLNEMTAGQEEVDDSILRDIHRTFPEHPYFGMEAGQKALFRVLKAYSLHDLEVAYCQGMAFMAGVLLMYVPEEIAFRLFCRLMDPEGPNLRRLYLPGLEPLKAELATFELLLTWRLPELATHLAEFGLPPVLYVSQWLMTLFATPFPPAFCARVIDVLLQDGHDRLLLRCSYAVMEALEPELLARHDFEALITYLKMEPVSWGLNRQRAIMEHALTSPITDAEIEIARDTVSNRQYLAAATAAAAAAATAATGSAAAAAAAAAAVPEAAAVIQDLLGASVSVPSPGGAAAAAAAAAAGTGPALESRQISLEHEVEAALAVAAAAIAGGQVGHTGADGCRQGGDMISFGEEDQSAAGPGPSSSSAAAPDAGGRRRRSQCSARHASSGGGERGDVDGQGAGAPEQRGFGGGPAVSDPTVGNSSGSGRHASVGAAGPPTGSAAAYGISSSLLDELDLHGGRDGSGAAAASGGGGTAAGRGHGKRSDLEYGEYGEMLMEADLLLPELGTDGGLAMGQPGGPTGGSQPTDPWSSAVPGAAGGAGAAAGLGLGRVLSGDDGFGPFVRGPLADGMAGLSLGQQGAEQQQQQPPGGGDLLLD